ncbi:MAG TPA: hypothetical protein VF941_08840 [Clostridia bacterium]
MYTTNHVEMLIAIGSSSFGLIYEPGIDLNIHWLDPLLFKS